MDKYPNADGILDITDEKGFIKGKIDVQLKTLPKKYEKRPTYSCDKEFLIYCQDSTLPVILIVADKRNSKAYWRHMSYEILADISGKMTGQSYSLHLPLENCIDGKSLTYVNQWTQICSAVYEKVWNYDTLKEDHQQLAEQLEGLRGKFVPLTLEPDQVRQIQQFLDVYNYLLDHDFRIIKQGLYANYWKIGLGIMSYSADNCSFIVYPVLYGANETLIRQVEPSSIKDVGREFALGNILRTQSYSNSNPIRDTPEKLAYEMLQSDFDYIIKRVQFDVPDDFMANEYIHGFVEKFATFLGLEAGAESHDLLELRCLVTEALPLVLELKLNVAAGLTHLNHNIDSYQNLKPHPAHGQLIDEAKKRAASDYKPLVNIMPTSEQFHLDILRFYVDHLLQQGIRHTRRVYDPNTRLSRIGGFVWESWNNEVLTGNLMILMQNLKRVYQLLIERHFPGIVNELSLFRDGNLLMYCLSFEHGRHAGPQLEYYMMRSRAVRQDEIRFCTDKDRPFIRESLIYRKGWTIRIDGRVYDLRASGGEKLAFIFDPLPMHTFIREMLKERLTELLKKKIKVA